MARNDHCSYCGAKFAPAPFPRTCAACGNTTYVNPLPVAVCLLPVDGGLLCVRRGIEPRRGQIALPGGFIDLGESWQAACARELREETGIVIDAAQVRLFDALSAPDGTLLVFGAAKPVREADLPPFVATNETSERVILRAPAALAFPLHTQVVEKWFRQRA